MIDLIERIERREIKIEDPARCVWIFWEEDEDVPRLNLISRQREESADSPRHGLDQPRCDSLADIERKNCVYRLYKSVCMSPVRAGGTRAYVTATHLCY
jgi:hypothetical protein